jgi:hypothetical protein
MAGVKKEQSADPTGNRLSPAGYFETNSEGLHFGQVTVTTHDQ